MRFNVAFNKLFNNQISNNNQRGNIVKRNIAGSLIIKGFSILIQLILVPLTLKYLDSNLYGIWLTLSSILSWLVFFDIGFTLGLKNKLTEALAIKDYTLGKRLVSTTYAIMIAIFVPLCILLECIVPYINWSSLLNIANTYNSQITQVMQVLVICICLQMILNIIVTVLTAFQRVAISGLFPVIGNLLSVIIIYILTKSTKPSIVILALAVSFLPAFVLLVSSIYMYKNHLKSISPSFKSIDLSLIKYIFNLGAKFFIIQIQMLIVYQTTNILISNISNPTDVTAYNIAYKYISSALMIFTLILNPLWPAFTDAYTKKDFSWMSMIYKKMIYIYIFIAIIIILMIAVSPLVYDFWINSSSLIPFSMTLMVGIYILISSWNSLQIILINGVGKIQLQSYVTLIGLFLHIPISLLLGKYMQSLGVITSMILINIVYGIFFTIQINRIIGQKAKGIWIK